MTTRQSDADERERRWGEVLVACLESLEGGQETDRQAQAAAHPEFAEELAEFFAQRHRIERLAAANVATARTDADPRDDTLGTATGSSAETEVPSLGDYEILEEIARGGMGVVYKPGRRAWAASSP